MAVTLRVTGTWAELTADGSVAIPATPEAGDRMYLFARWKDFSITATVANWTELTEFADGAVGSGNGTGSVKVGCWYRDWQSGDTDPAIDFSASPTNASVVIMVMQKGVDDVWDTPIARTAAMTNWTTSSQSVSASSSAAVKSGSVVMGLIGIRDDTATMTRPTTGIDDSVGAITWNGNYVESPATHHSTTTGDDGAADLGYRQVTLGATATLRMTGTISAAETGAALWVIQSTTIVVTPAPASFLLASFTPTLNTAVTPALASMGLSAFAPMLSSGAVPAMALLEVGTFAPLLISSVVTAPAAFFITPFGPTLFQSVSPATATLAISASSPSLVGAIIPETQSLAIISFAPTLAGAATPSAVSLVLTTFPPSLWPPGIVFLDPGGDAVQAPGYPNSIIGAVTFDTAKKVVGVGSWKHDSTGSNTTATSTVAGVMGTARRVSLRVQYDSVPDTSATVTESPAVAGEAYSGGGFTDADQVETDDGFYATATPAKNSGQGSVLGVFGFGGIGGGGAAIIDSIKIIYERKYDVDTSIGISRVKWRVNGEEGPNHDNTDMPLTDTLVEVDITGDRFWEPQDLLNGVFGVIAEARRGDTDTAHTQSWDYLAVEVVYHTAVPIIDLVNGGVAVSQIALLPKGSGVVARFVDAAGNSFDGITELAPDVFHRVSFSYLLSAADALSINIFIEDIPELSLVEMSTGGSPGITDLRYGWTVAPGANRVCWFDQIAIDDGDDLTDIGNVLSTAKRGITVNNDNFDTTGGTGAVNERPVNLDNYRAQIATAQVTQDYTLEAVDEGDVDISGKTLRGYMGWLVAKKTGGLGGSFGFILNGNITNLSLPTSPAFLKLPVTRTSYPSDAAGIGLRSATTSHDAYLYECGAVVAYEGPIINAPLFPYQLLAEDSVTPVTDDLRSDLPDTYELLLEASESGAQVSVEVYAITSEGQEPQYRQTLNSGGGSTREPINNPGIEISLVIRVTGGNAYVRLRRRLNV